MIESYNFDLSEKSFLDQYILTCKFNERIRHRPIPLSKHIALTDMYWNSKSKQTDSIKIQLDFLVSKFKQLTDKVD